MAPADDGRVPAGLYLWPTAALRTLSLLACLVVVLSFALFAVDQMTAASDRQANSLAASPVGPTAPTSRPAAPARRDIDRLSSELTSPFANVTGSSNRWAMRTSQTLIAVLIYGLGVSFLARCVRLGAIRGPRRGPRGGARGASRAGV